MVLTTGYMTVATKLQEAAMMHGDVRSRLQDAINDAHRGTGSWGSYIDHSGDGESGDVIYSSGGDIRKAPYELGNVGGKATANVDMDSSTNVVPCTSYQEEADDDDHYAQMVEAGLYTPGPLPLCERFISKDERAKLPKEDFAGKGDSFPIAKPQDVGAAVHAMGRAGDKNVGMSTLKSRIIAIAKRKGWTEYLPKAWRGDSTSASEAARRPDGVLALRESATAMESMISLREASAKGDYEIKLIAPGKGAMAYYPADVLKRDGAKAFPAETKVYLNHPTKQQEAEGPGNRDVKRLAGVLSTAAEWKENHKNGPGLYSRVKAFADHAQLLEEKSPYLAMSIMANGRQAVEAGRPAFKDGLPLLASLEHGESVDVVPIAGAGGLFVRESADALPNSQEVDMTDEQITKLAESLAKALKPAVPEAPAAVKAIEARLMKADATVEAHRVLSPLALREGAKQLVVRNILREANFPVKDGELDTAKFGDLVMAEAQSVAMALGEGGGVHGMGLGAPVAEIDEKKLRKEEKRLREAREEEGKEMVEVFESIGMPKSAAEISARGKVA